MGAIFVLGAVMALFGILGYLYGTRSAFLLAVVIGLALLVFARAGDRIIRLINTFYRFGVAGLSLIAGGGEDVTTALSRAPRQPLIAETAAGAALILLLLILIAITLAVSRYRRFRGPSSVLGLLIGLVTGYLIGGYLLVTWIPELGAVLPLPFGLSTAPPGVAVTAANISLSERFIRLVQSTDPATLRTAGSIIIVLIVIVAVLLATRGRGGAGSRGSGARQ